VSRAAQHRVRLDRWLAFARRGQSTGRWADQSDSATTMTTQAVIVGRGDGLLTWGGGL
jgi:hypothetical protein